ncbi:MAG: restriction endonuclease subunit S [Gammaproteobacteria bacterium]|nr:restriction endonuclease subunit S [Gammaproteobacteria bacterium]
MNADGLLAIYDRAVDTPDVTARLRRFVLDLAVRGKLVEQDPNDEPASALLDRITAEKAKLTGKGNLSVASVTDPDSGHQIPFSLPAGWVKTTIGEICSKTGSGSTPRGGKQAYKESGIVFLRSQNIHNDGLRLTNVAYISPATHKRMSGTAVRPSDLLLNITGGSIGRCCLVPDEVGQANVSQHVSIIRIAFDGPQRFLHYVILAPYFQTFVLDEQTGAGRGGLPKYKMDRIPVALPPLAEQQRVVAKIEELMALCDQLVETRLNRKETRAQLTQTTLARLSEPHANTATFRSHARFAIETLPALTTRADQLKNLRHTILNLAVRGKLVKQNPADEPASTLLTRIAAVRESVPVSGRKTKKKTTDRSLTSLAFQLPDGWASAQLADLVRVLNGRAYKKAELLDSGTPVLRVGNLFTSKQWYYSNLELENDKYCEAGDLIYAWSASFGPFIWDGPRVIYHYHIWKLPILSEKSLDKQFLYFFLLQKTKEIKSAGHGVSMVHMTKKKMEQIVVPVPPLPEQHRIVAKVDELMALCDQLEASLSDMNTTRSCLLESVLRAAL